MPSYKALRRLAMAPVRQGLYRQVTPTLGRFRTAAMHNSPQTPSFPYLAHWLSVVAGICLAACVQSPQAAVPAHAMPPMELALDAGTGGCVVGERLRTALAGARTELQAQGLALKASCHAGQGALIVQVDVVDSLRASAVVRGPFAEGEPVDMGTPAGASDTKAANDNVDISPDVQHNRQWLRAVMARHQFHNLPNAWWHFAYQAASQPAMAEVDLAER